MTLRRRLGLTIAPLVALVLGIGGAGLWLLNDLGRRSEAILRENYISLRAMANLHGYLTDAERMVLFAEQQGDRVHPDVLAGFRRSMDGARVECRIELNNVTEPGEQEGADQLAAQIEMIKARGESLIAAPTAERHELYVDPERGFQPAVTKAWRHLQAIRVMNEAAMEHADQAARNTSRRSAWILTGTTTAAVVFAAAATLGLLRTILRPVEDLTRSARAVGDGQLEQMVSAETEDEIGELVAAFNRMTMQLRDLRQTQSAQLLRAQQTSQAAIDSFPDPVLVVDPAGRVEMANPAALRVLGVAPGTKDSAPVWQPPESLREPLAVALRTQRPVLTQSFDHAIIYLTGSDERAYLPQVLPVRDPYGNTLGAAVVLTDITRFRLLDEFKTDLVATASHELKTPLTGLRLAVHLLLEEAVGPITAKQTELLIDARENTERLVRIVDHMLTLARMERGREPVIPKPEDPVGLLRATADRVQPLLNGRRVVIDTDPAVSLPPVAVDAQRIGAALDNLVTNAATYSDPDGQVTLSARPAGDGWIELAVRDTGVGIPTEHLPHVFDKFFRIPGQSRGQGTGLGLAIVKETVLAHSGEITCESEPGHGTTFRIRLPVWAGGAS